MTWREDNNHNYIEDEEQEEDEDEENGAGGLATVDPSDGSDEAMRGWLVALQLMQDDDEDIRDVASQAITLSSRTDAGTGTGANIGPSVTTTTLSEPLPMVHGRVLEIMGERVGHVLSWCINSSNSNTDKDHLTHRNSNNSGSEASPCPLPQGVLRTLDELTRLIGTIVE